MEDVVNPDTSFWAGKRVLLTGHSGFKGGWLAAWLHRLGAAVTGFALPPDTSPSLHDGLKLPTRIDGRFGDLRNAETLAQLVAEVQPEIVFHLAAQPLVRASYGDPVGTFATNVQGTVHLLEAIRRTPGVRAVVAVTTDKVYHNIESPLPYREGDRLGGHDPYSASKAAAEIVVASYRAAFLAAAGVRVATARAGNVIGGGDWSVDRLLPDAIRAWGADAPLHIRRPDATRPWQHVVEPVCAYLVLAEQLYAGSAVADAYNFGPNPDETASVRTVADLALAEFGIGTVTYEAHATGPHEAGLLALDIGKARDELGIAPRWGLAEAVGRTVRWYRAAAAGADPWQLCADDIAAFEAAA